MPDQDSTTLKRCTKCGAEYLATAIFFGRDKNKKDGLSAWCRDCINSARLERYYRNPEKDHAYWRQRYNDNPDFRAQHIKKVAQWKKANPEKAKAYQRATSTRQKYKDYQRQYNQRWQRAHPEKVREYNRRWYSSNGGVGKRISAKWRVQNREYDAERKRQWRRAHPEMVKAAIARRWALEHGAPGSHTAADVRRKYQEQNGRCYYCEIELGNDYHLDHYIPLSRGGSNDADNIVLACSACNLSKGSKMPGDWLRGKGKLL